MMTPQLSEHCQKMIDKRSLEFDVLSDPGNEYVAQLGLRFELPDYLKTAYIKFGIDLAQQNGEDSWTLPMPARLVVDREGIIRAVDVNPDYTRRQEPQDTVDFVAELQTA